QSAGRVFSDAMAQPKIGTTGLKGTPQQILLGTAHTSGVRQDEEPRLFRDAKPLKTRFQFLSTTFCPAAGFSAFVGDEVTSLKYIRLFEEQIRLRTSSPAFITGCE